MSFTDSKPHDYVSSTAHEKPKGMLNNMRFVLITMSGLSTGFMFMMRLCFTVAIVSMVNHTELYRLEHENKTQLDEDDAIQMELIEDGEDSVFVWTHEMQQTIIGSYMIAYTVPQIIVSKLSEKVGIRWSVFAGLLLNILGSGTTPIVAYWGYEWVILLRAINGVGGSMMLAMNLHAIEKWIPVDESTTSLILVQFVGNLMVIGSPLFAGYFSAIHWKWAFYAPAFISIVFAIVWILIIRDDIIDSPAIGNKEANYIFNKRPPNYATVMSNKKIEWSLILLNPSYYWCMLCWIAFELLHYSLVLFLVPDYLHKALNVSAIENGLYNFIILSGSLVSMILPQYFILLLINNFKFNITVARRITYSCFNCLAMLPLIYCAIFHNYQVLSFFLVQLFSAADEIILTSTLVTKYGPVGLSSMAFSVINTVGCLSIAPGSYFAGLYLDSAKASLSSWSNLFYVATAINLVSILIYCTFVDSEPLKPKDDAEVEIKSKICSKHLESFKLQNMGRKTSLSRQMSVNSISLHKMSKD